MKMNITKDIKLLLEDFSFQSRNIKNRDEDKKNMLSQKQKITRELFDRQIEKLKSNEVNIDNAIINCCQYEEIKCSEFLKWVLKKEFENGTYVNLLDINNKIFGKYGISSFEYDYPDINQMEYDKYQDLIILVKKEMKTLLAELRSKNIRFIIRNPTYL